MDFKLLVLEPSRFRTLALALIVVTIGVFSVLDRYEVDGAQLLADPQFVLDDASWELGRRDGAIERTTGLVALDGKQGVVVIRQRIEPPNAEGLRLVAEQRFVPRDQLGPGLARVLLLGHSGRPRWDLPFGSLLASDDGEWRQSSTDIRVDSTVSSFTVYIQNMGVPGQLEVRRVELYPLRTAALFKWSTGFVLICWLGLGALCVLSVIRASGGWLGKLVVLGIATTIIVGTLFPKPTLVSSVREIHAVTRAAPGPPVVPVAFWHRLEMTQKTMHLVLFVLLVFALCWWRPRAKLGELVVAVILFAVSTELLQSYAVDRQPGLGDLALDLLGALIGLVLGLAAIGLRGSLSED